MLLMAVGMLADGRGPYTRDYLAHTPDDGRRYELIDGYLFVSAAPGLVHQRVVGRLLLLLNSSAGSDHEVLPGPFAVALGENTEIQPDIVVGRVADFTEREIVRPALVVEVLSPSTRQLDLNRKRWQFERAGVAAYWVVDPVARPAEASLLALELGPDGAYQQAAHVTGEDVFETNVPFPVRVVPADLVR